MGDIGKYIVIGGAVLIVAVIFLDNHQTRNGFVVLQNRVKNQLAQIDVQLKRRYDLIPNLLETAKGYANFEREHSGGRGKGPPERDGCRGLRSGGCREREAPGGASAAFCGE